MTTKPKIHTIEFSEQELARALFVMRNVNGKDFERALSSVAMEKLGVGELGKIDFDVLHSKAIELAKTANIPTFINYYSIQKEWEEFLGIGEVDAEKESELAELKGKL